MSEHVEGAEIRRVREALGEDQSKFGARWGKHRRTIIRWEKSGHRFSSWGQWYGYGYTGERKPTELALWEQAKKDSTARSRKPNGASAKDGAPRPAVRVRVKARHAKGSGGGRRGGRSRGAVTRAAAGRVTRAAARRAR